MRTQRRQRRYVGRHWLILMRPMLHFSRARNAFVLRVVGNRFGPVLRAERRRADLLCPVERRRVPPFTAAERQRTRIVA